MTPDDIRKWAHDERGLGISELLLALAAVYEAANVYWQHPSNSNWDVVKQALARVEALKP